MPKKATVFAINKPQSNQISPGGLMKKLKLIVVDDDPYILKSIESLLPEAWSMESFDNHDFKIDAFSHYHAAFVDMHLSSDTNKAEGIKVIENLKRQRPELNIIAMSGNLDRNNMESCINAGATRFIAKPLNPEELIHLLEKVEAYQLLKEAQLRGQKSFQKWVGNSNHSLALQKQISNFKGEPGPILIEGSTGTGKELVAEMLHFQEPKTHFIKINIAAIPENLFESELFGHVKGAFTGAVNNKMGLAEAAHGGDLFIDEIEALTLPLQVKLLRFLESGEIRRIGSSDVKSVNTRVIIATNKNLETLVEQGKFRSDLLWRINGKKISIPALKSRPQDIEDLAQYFLNKKTANKSLDIEAIHVLKQQEWPGNVRELKRLCEKLLLTAPLPVIRAEDVLAAIDKSPYNVTDETLSKKACLAQIINKYEKEVLLKALCKYKDVEVAAENLQISRSSLYKKIKDYDINWKMQQ